MHDITFAYPEFFYLFIIIPFLIIYYVLKNKKQKASLRIPSLEGFKKAKPSFRQGLRHILPVLRILILSLLIFALARPQTKSSTKKIKTEGIDIMVTIDISGSMKAEDFKPNRLGAAKLTAIQFIKKRKNDRIGLVVFSGKSFTLCPPTVDKKLLIKLFKKVNVNLIAEDGTAIGEGLATAINRLKDSKVKSKVIILLTDGVNNTGNIDPLTAAEIAKEYGIKVYTIGVGSRGYAPYPVQDPWGRTVYRQMKVEIDENILKQIAAKTGGTYFRATKNTDLTKIYGEINKMEKSKIDESVYTSVNEEFLPFALLAAILLGIELLLRLFVLRSLP